MTTRKHRSDLRMVVVAVVLVSMLFAAPALDGKLRENTQSQRNSQPSRQVSARAFQSRPPQTVQLPRAPNSAAQFGNSVLQRLGERRQVTFSNAPRPAQTPSSSFTSPPASYQGAQRPQQPSVSLPQSSPRPDSAVRVIRPSQASTGNSQAPSAPTPPSSNQTRASSGPIVITGDTSSVLRRSFPSEARQVIAATSKTSTIVSSTDPKTSPVSVLRTTTKDESGSAGQSAITSARNSLVGRLAERQRSASAAAQQRTAGASGGASPDKTGQIGSSTNEQKPSASSATKRLGADYLRSAIAERIAEKRRLPSAGSANQVPTDQTTGQTQIPAKEQQAVVSQTAERPGAGAGGSAYSQRRNTLADRINDRIRALDSKKQNQAAGVGDTSPKESGLNAPASVDRGRSVLNRPNLRELIDRKKVEIAQRSSAKQGNLSSEPDTGKSQKDSEETLGARLREFFPRRQATGMNSALIKNIESPGRTHSYQSREVKQAHVVVHDRPDRVEHVQHPVHTFLDRHDRMCHQIVSPGYHYPVCYRHGPHSLFWHVHPFYHRKYIFVSLGGYWPWDYSYMRYYWYGCHPYFWYGYYPIPHEVGNDTYNYYTYNYYTDEQASSGQYSADSAPAGDYVQPVDHTTFADIREKLAQQAREPAAQTQADTLFEEAVKTFESGDYASAGERFANAMELSPDDVILPFAYSQALFAQQEYSQAAEVLRQALAKVSPDKEAVFYPRGLYSNDELLFEHIERLLDKVELYGYDADLQLLLGYQLLGLGETDFAVEPLERAGEDMQNAAAAKVLLGLVEKIKSENASGNTPAGAGKATQITGNQAGESEE